MRFQVTANSPRLGLQMLPEVKLDSRIRAMAAELAFRTEHPIGERMYFNTKNYIALPRGAKYLGSGLYRDAYRVGDLVYKVGKTHQARKGGNLTEKFFFDRLREDGWGWFAPHVAVIPAGQHVVSIMHYIPYSSYGASDEWNNYKYIGEISDVLHRNYNYPDGHGHNLVINSNTDLPVLIDGGHAWGWQTPHFRKQAA
jgi:hypothetical protein